MLALVPAVPAVPVVLPAVALTGLRHPVTVIVLLLELVDDCGYVDDEDDVPLCA